MRTPGHGAEWRAGLFLGVYVLKEQQSVWDYQRNYPERPDACYTFLPGVAPTEEAFVARNVVVADREHPNRGWTHACVKGFVKGIPPADIEASNRGLPTRMGRWGDSAR